jgi:YHS domain-containing protein
MLIELALLALAALPQSEEGHAPPALAPFEHLVGVWKGQAVNPANRIRGWTETHSWSWVFEKSVPVALSVQVEGSKSFLKGSLRPTGDGGSKLRLDGYDPEGQALAYEGAFDPKSRALVLDRIEPKAGPAERIVLRPNSNLIRYTLRIERKEAGSPQFKPVADMNLGKEGESFAAGGAATEAPKCVVTGGAATLNVVYQGRSFPLCCTGCKEEFDANPEKYVRKAALMAQKDGAASAPAAPTNRRGSDDEFDAVVGTPDRKKPAMPTNESARVAPGSKSSSSKISPNRATTLWKLGQALERQGKIPGALDNYRRIVREHPNSPEAKSASERIRALDVPSQTPP